MDGIDRPREALAFLRENMYERMDAFVAVNEESRREFHLQRYRFAASELEKARARGGCVLDAACGTGYGSRILLASCARYVGVDVSPEAIAYARRFYGGDDARFEIGDAGTLPFLADASVDAVVSFETIEHLSRDLETLAEFRRVLKPDGWFFSSVPNGWPLTIYHLNDYRAETYRLLLDRYFDVVAIYNQSCGKPVSVEDLQSAECLLAVARPKVRPDLAADAVRALSLNQIDNLIAHKQRLEAEIRRVRAMSVYRFGPLYHRVRRLLRLES